MRLFPKKLGCAAMVRGLYTKKLQASAVKKVDNCVVFSHKSGSLIVSCDIALFIEAVLRYIHIYNGCVCIMCVYILTYISKKHLY